MVNRRKVHLSRALCTHSLRFHQETLSCLFSAMLWSHWVSRLFFSSACSNVNSSSRSCSFAVRMVMDNLYFRLIFVDDWQMPLASTSSLSKLQILLLVPPILSNSLVDIPCHSSVYAFPSKTSRLLGIKSTLSNTLSAKLCFPAPSFESFGCPIHSPFRFQWHRPLRYNVGSIFLRHA